jgi:hypothetical protein
MWPRVLRFVVALAVAAVVWYNLTTVYDGALAAVATPLLRIDPRFRDARLTAHDRVINVAARERHSDFPPADIPADQLTYNVILLAALFASNRRPFRDRNVVAFLKSLALLIVLHVAGVLLSVESTYAVRMGAWSGAHYGTGGYYLWLYAEIFYRLVGMFGVVFVCWWASSATINRS